MDKKTYCGLLPWIRALCRVRAIACKGPLVCYQQSACQHPAGVRSLSLLPFSFCFRPFNDFAWGPKTTRRKPLMTNFFYIFHSARKAASKGAIYCIAPYVVDCGRGYLLIHVFNILQWWLRFPSHDSWLRLRWKVPYCMPLGSFLA